MKSRCNYHFVLFLMLISNGASRASPGIQPFLSLISDRIDRKMLLLSHKLSLVYCLKTFITLMQKMCFVYSKFSPFYAESLLGQLAPSSEVNSTTEPIGMLCFLLCKFGFKDVELIYLDLRKCTLTILCYKLQMKKYCLQ